MAAQLRRAPGEQQGGLRAPGRGRGQAAQAGPGPLVDDGERHRRGVQRIARHAGGRTLHRKILQVALNALAQRVVARQVGKRLHGG
ncbi:hypothetical protein LRS03_13390 [Rhizobacter sp. J219]|uniref:hypothetical protein n=1 Tax=Rhizobacter sp. J219 TaxID=2898430 RepID=UPI002150DFBE|nr:hypothetical protein [Rhizobacter sp. J219]MCR5883798.1 hypothetical protein [Rhizobacter sp. J219]